MSFFPSCSGFMINGGIFNLQTEDAAATQVLGKRKRQDSECDNSRRQRSRILDSDGLMILKAGDVKLHRELISDGNNSYRIHAASHRRRLVVVKTFEGPRAKQDWKLNVAFSKKCLHPNVLQIAGISDESSTSHFIQFRGITSEQKMQWLIANALGTDLNTSVQLSMKAVKGIAAGLSYIKSQKIPVMYAGTMNNNQKWDNFDILTGYENEPIIAFHLSSTEDGLVSQNLDIKTDSRGVEVLNGLCDQLFSGAHSILYDDSPKRDFDVYDGEGLPLATATLEHEESTSNLSELEGEAISNRSSSMENPKPSRKPRREVWWLDLGTTNHSLKSIRRCFEDRLNWSQLSSSNSLLRRIRSPKDDNLRRNLHKCPGYLREEITLTCDLSKSVIVSHAFPGLSERCSICHRLVQYTYSESFDHFAPVGGIDPSTPNKGGKSSDASSVMDEDFLPSLSSDEEIMQSMQSMADPDVCQDMSLPGFQWMAQSQQNLGVDISSGQTPSSSTSHKTLQPDTGFQCIVDETRPAVSFPSPSQNHAQSNTGSSSESSPTREQQVPAQDSHEMKMNIDVDFAMDDPGMSFGSDMASVTNNSSSRTAYNDSWGNMEIPTNDELPALPDDLHHSQVPPSASHQQPYSRNLLSAAGLASNPKLSFLLPANDSFLSTDIGHFRRASSGTRSNRGGELCSSSGMQGTLSPRRSQTCQPRSNVPSSSQTDVLLAQVLKVNVTTGRTANASHRRRKEDAKFICTVPGCGSTFTRVYNLKGHLRSHFEEKPYQCHWPGCGKNFARQHDCKRHEQLHTSNFRRFECEGCRKQFARMDVLNRHLRSENGVECAKIVERGKGPGGVMGNMRVGMI